MSYIDSKQIEKRALLAVENYFIKSKVVHTYLSENDKEPFWDGHFYLYSNERKTKDNFIGRIAVQVKGKLKKKQVANNILSYPIEMSDLNAYSSEGVMYFVVLQTEAEDVIYYKSLTPIIIRNIKRINKGKISANIRMNLIPFELKEMESELIDFNTNCKKQVSFAESKVLNFEDLQKLNVNKLTFVAHGYDKTQHIVDFLTKKSVYVYAVMMDGANFEVPVGEGPMHLTFTRYFNEPLKIKDKSYFSSYTLIVNKDLITIKCDDSLILEFPKETADSKGKLTFTCHSNMLSDIINDLEFILVLTDNQQIDIGNLIFNIKAIESFDKKVIKDKLTYLYKIRELLQMLTCNFDLDVSKMSEEDYNTIDLLIESICNKKLVRLEGNETCIMSLHLSNLVLQLVIFKKESGLFEIFNFFDSTHVFAKKYDNVLKEIPSFAIMDKNMFADCSNIPYSHIVPIYDKLKIDNPYIIEMANLNLLEMLHAVDKMDREDRRFSDFIKALNSFALWILENESINERKMLQRINQLQIVKRQRGLSAEEILELKKLLIASSISDMEKCAIYILLDDKEMIDIYIHRLSEDKINELKAFPIWNVIKDNNV